jgi:aspartyl-tRNA(Asn)/glutamyl-tRNA(Gln) amidotransferase subunit B
LPKLFISEIVDFKNLKDTLPELPWEKRERLLKLGISAEHAEIYLTDTWRGNLFETTVSQVGDTPEFIKLTSNYVVNDLKKSMQPEILRELMAMITAGELSSRGAKEVIKVLEEKGGQPVSIARENNLMQESDREVLQKLVDEIIKEHAGKPTQFLVGEAMKKTGGRANPVILQELFKSLGN